MSHKAKDVVVLSPSLSPSFEERMGQDSRIARPVSARWEAGLVKEFGLSTATAWEMHLPQSEAQVHFPIVEESAQ